MEFVFMFDWRKEEKENVDVEPDKMVEQQHKAEQMYENLQRSGDGENFKVEEEKTVMGQRRRFNVTGKNGEKTDVDITENAQVEVRGEQKEVQDAIERGEKISSVQPTQNTMSGVQQDVISRINSSNLSEAEKKLLREDVEKHNFADNQQTSEQYTQNVQETINAKENSKLGNGTKIKMSDKIMELRGLGNNDTKSKKSTNGQEISKTPQTMNFVRNMTSLRSY